MLRIPSPLNYSSFVKELPIEPGVYKFKDLRRRSIYIGKAKNLKNRLKSYLSESNNKTKKSRSILSESYFIDLVLTKSELESLLLEQHLIKEEKPKYNVQFKDDKGYPWISFEKSKKYPSVKSFLGRKNKKDLYFGPFPSSISVKNVLELIQKVFKLRDCTDSFFKNRKRPCLQFEIGRCSAPCVGQITEEDYLQEVEEAKKLLKGNSEDLLNDLYELMDLNSERKLYERAASYRDKISALREIQRNQSTSGFLKERDAISISQNNLTSRIGITEVRGGWIVSHRNFIAENFIGDTSILESFIINHYLNQVNIPSDIVTSGVLANKRILEEALSDSQGKQIRIITKPGKKDLGLIEISQSNTDFSLKRANKNRRNLGPQFLEIQNLLKKTTGIKNIEAIDVSHHSGKNAVGASVVYDQRGKRTDKYRLYNLKKENMGDDIASMKEVIRRRYGKKNNEGGALSDLLIIDGGYTHLKAARSELEKLKISAIGLVALSKGFHRKEEFDSLVKEDGAVLNINRRSKAHLILQEIRDESHRFSIKNQRKNLAKQIRKSVLDDVQGVGSKNKLSLLRYFGDVEHIKKASITDLINVNGIGKHKATAIYNYFQSKI